MHTTETFGGWSFRLNNILNLGKVDMNCQIQALAAGLPEKSTWYVYPLGAGIAQSV